MKEGWLCPRCGKINNPNLISCSCLPLLDDPSDKEGQDEYKTLSKDPNIQNHHENCAFIGWKSGRTIHQMRYEFICFFTGHK